jgi:hypothetical protein
LLAFSSNDHVERTIADGLRAFTEHTITSPARLRHSLAVTRLTRVAVSRREFEADIYGVAMPVFGPGGHVIAAIEIGAANIDDELQRFMSPLLIAVRSLSRELAGASTHAPRTAVRDAPSFTFDCESIPMPVRSNVTRIGVDALRRPLAMGLQAHAE